VREKEKEERRQTYLYCCLDGRELPLHLLFLPNEQQGRAGFFAFALGHQPARGLRETNLGGREGEEGGRGGEGEQEGGEEKH
jgi:hypothetical protein